MFRIAASIFVALLFTASSVLALPHVDLNGDWSLQQGGHDEIIHATVPGCVHTDLLAANKIPDPFYRDNESKLQWISTATWVYARKFTVPPEILNLDHLKLRCEGLDTVATVNVNGKDLAHTDNMFRTWEFDVRGLLSAGDNTIRITFTPAADYMKAHASDPAFPGLGVTKTGAIRKEACNFGWDWGPKLTTAGIWKSIAVVGWNEARLSGVLINQDLKDKDHAYLDIDVAAETDGAVPLATETTVKFHDAVIASVTQPLRQQDGVGRTTVKIDNPQRWWPNGMGPQNLYTVETVLKDGSGQVLDQTTKRIGLRTVEWLAKTDSRPLGLSVNGHPFFAKGVNWIPPTVFAPQVTPELLRKYMADAASVNVNTIRLWGGGYYEEDALYDLCDELGILLWVDFKFASSAYPAHDPAFVENVRAEERDNVLRLRHHPSIAVWCGNNEVRLSYFAKDRGGDGVMSFTDYDHLYHDIIGGDLKDLSPQAVYTPGSPEAGDDHYWGVWHGNQPFEAYEELEGFMSEYGFESFPSPRTVDSFTVPADRESVDTEVMQAHQKSGKLHNEKITRMISTYFHPGKDFDAMLWLSQITQSYGIVRGIEHWRRDWPNSTGSIIWQYNDCWPGATWAIVDSFGRWKTLMYQVRHAYAPLLVSAEADPDGAAKVSVSSDRMDPCQPTLRWSLTRADGTELLHGTQTVEVPSGTCNVTVATLSFKEQMAKEGAGNVLLWLALSDQGKVVSENLKLFTKPKFVQLADPAIKADVTESSEGFTVKLAAQYPALWTWLELSDTDATFSDNFVHLAKEQPVEIEVKPAKGLSLEEFKKQLRVRSLYDTFDPNIPEPIVTQAADGTLFAPAAMADVVGSTAGLNDNKPNAVAGWESAKDSVVWRVRIDQPGRYSVTPEVACPAPDGGSDYTVTVGDQHVNGTVPNTKDWDDYRMTPLGNVEIAQAGEFTVTVKATKKPHKFVMNLRSLTLKPVPSAAP